MNQISTGDEFLDDRCEMFIHFSTLEEMEVQDVLRIVHLSFEDLMADWYRAGRDKRLSAVGWITMSLHDFEETNKAAVMAIWEVMPSKSFTDWWFFHLALYKGRVEATL